MARTPQQDQAFWDKELKPGRVNERGSKDYMIGPINFAKASQSQLRERAGIMAFGTSGYKREQLLNELGFLTKAQKQNWKTFTPAERDASINGSRLFGNPYVGGAGKTGGAIDDFLSKREAGKFKAFFDNEGKLMYKKNMGAPLLTSVMTRGYALYMLAGMGHNGDAPHETLSSMIGMSGLQTGFGIGANLGGSMAAGAAGRLAFGAVGSLMGAGLVGAAYYGVSNTLLNSTSSDNWMTRLSGNLSPKQRLNVGFSEQQQMHTSQRQRVMSKLSKSAINDRGQFMGNEAMALRGIM